MITIFLQNGLRSQNYSSIKIMQEELKCAHADATVNGASQPIEETAEFAMLNARLEECKRMAGELDEASGIVNWKFNLKPKETKKVTLTYTVKFPKDKALAGL